MQQAYLKNTFEERLLPNMEFASQFKIEKLGGLEFKVKFKQDGRKNGVVVAGSLDSISNSKFEKHAGNEIHN